MKFRYLRIGVWLKRYLKNLNYCFRFLKRDLGIPITITPLKCLRPSYIAYIKHFYIKSSRKITPCKLLICVGDYCSDQVCFGVVQ